jgi:hypothetical protein
MFALTVALLVTTFLSFAFSSTRRIGLLSIALLAFLFPRVAAVLLFIGVIAVVFITFPRRTHHEL